MNFSAVKSKFLIMLCVGAAVVSFSACSEILQKPQPETFAGQNAPPAAQEFRWSNGNLPKTLDPAKAVAPPETDVARAIFEGLTDLDAKTLRPVPAIATHWEASEDFRTWVFQLRSDARWTNGKTITANDFVKSWRRVLEIGDKTQNAKLFANIVGANLTRSAKCGALDEKGNCEQNLNENQKSENQKPEDESLNKSETRRAFETWFGVEALNDTTLRVWLVEPDKDFPALVAHPAFRPVFDDGANFENLEFAPKIISNGAFRIGEADKNGVLLERSKNYWNVKAVNLARVRLVPMKDAETALAAYRAGELDAVTNVSFEPLAVKLLASYQDFRRNTYNAVTFYEFNKKQPHLADKRVRQALALAIDRERLTQDEMDGAGVPAGAFLPHPARKDFNFNVEEARKLFSDAGFENGKNFPKLKLLIARNDLQRRVARAVASQWKKNLGIETEIVVSSFEDLEQTFSTGDFDLVRRAVVLPTTDETANLQIMFAKNVEENSDSNPFVEIAPNVAKTPESELKIVPKIGGIEVPQLVPNEKDLNVGREIRNIEQIPILTEEQAVEEFPAIPLYYPYTYALIKPYVLGFETNMLDAPSLKSVEIQTDWQR